jgi:hypothetical protein
MIHTATTKYAADMIALLGSPLRHGGVCLTTDELRHLLQFYGYTPEDNPLFSAGAHRGVARDADRDGFRIMAVIARYLDLGADPVQFVVSLMVEAGYDVADLLDDEQAVRAQG